MKDETAETLADAARHLLKAFRPPATGGPLVGAMAVAKALSSGFTDDQVWALVEMEEAVALLDRETA